MNDNGINEARAVAGDVPRPFVGFLVCIEPARLLPPGHS
jgi:hypothetical protein